MKLVTVSEMQSIERQADASGLSYALMMENAGRGLAQEISRRYSLYDEAGLIGTAGGLVGPGNNGGDTLVALVHLAEHNWSVSACLVRPRPENDPLIERFVRAGGGFVPLESLQPWLQSLHGEDIILDGILGTGVHLPLKSDLAQTLGLVRSTLLGMADPPHVIAVDSPSGVDCDSGEAAAECIPAEITVTMAAVKQGLLKFPAYSLVGVLSLAGIGPLDDLPAWQSIRREVVDEARVKEILPPRPLDAHKGTFGTVLVVAGSVNFTGAALLSGKAAYRIGAGWVTMAVPEPLHAALAGQFPEAPWLLLPHENGFIAEAAAEVVLRNLGKPTALLIGPGFGLKPTTGQFLANLLSPSLPPLVIDADGLKLLARLPDWPARLPSLTVLTPHPGEMAVLTGLPLEQIQADRFASAEKFAELWGHVVVLKGAFTVIASPAGQTAVIPVATPALARAGTGDVLTGVIAGLLAQGAGAFEAAAAGAWIHAQAGLHAAEKYGTTASVLAGDVLDSLSEVLRGM
jgi:ADP-dependent NAD(P)H-hydrate dehydratase / NAD(P)H-hydrate epimerase